MDKMIYAYIDEYGAYGAVILLGICNLIELLLKLLL